jgi:hypothetical protein
MQPIRAAFFCGQWPPFKKNSEIGGRQVESFVLYYTKVYPYDFTKGGVFL